MQLPQLRVALLGGSLLVALHLLAEFGALQMLRYPTFTTAIYDQYRATFNGPAPPCWPASWCCSAWCCCWPSCGCAGGAATRAPARGGPARPAGARWAR